jgi:hypothetical protein
MTQYRIDFRSMPWTSGTSGVRQKVFRANNRQLRLVEYSKAMHQHWCEKGHTEYVLNGKMEIEFENERSKHILLAMASICQAAQNTSTWQKFLQTRSR